MTICLNTSCNLDVCNISTHTASKPTPPNSQLKPANTQLIHISDEAKALFKSESEKQADSATVSSSENSLKNDELSHEDHAHNHDEAGHDHGENNNSNKINSKNDLSDEEIKQVRELQARDREVRAHEQAHINASGAIPTSGANYDYQTGPDGRKYAVGGDVKFSVPESDCPEEQLKLAQQLKKMALAPANPSSTDRAVAAEATNKEMQAREEIAKQRSEEQSGDNEENSDIMQKIRAYTQPTNQLQTGDLISVLA